MQRESESSEKGDSLEDVGGVVDKNGKVKKGGSAHHRRRRNHARERDTEEESSESTVTAASAPNANATTAFPLGIDIYEEDEKGDSWLYETRL